MLSNFIFFYLVCLWAPALVLGVLYLGARFLQRHGLLSLRGCLAVYIGSLPTSLILWLLGHSLAPLASPAWTLLSAVFSWVAAAPRLATLRPELGLAALAGAAFTLAFSVALACQLKKRNRSPLNLALRKLGCGKDFAEEFLSTVVGKRTLARRATFGTGFGKDSSS